MGGEVARYLAAYGADRVAKAVLISAVTPYLLKTDSNPDGVDASVFEGIVAGLKEDRPAFLEQFGSKFYGRTLLNNTVSSAFLKFTQEMALTGHPRQRSTLWRPGVRRTSVRILRSSPCRHL